MGRKRKKLKSFGGSSQRRKSRRSAEEPPPITLTFREKFVVIGLPISVVLAFFVLVCYGLVKRHRGHVENEIERRIAKWRVEHQLTEEEVESIREIEIEFHGDGISALLGTEPSAEEKRLHKETIDNLLKK